MSILRPRNKGTLYDEDSSAHSLRGRLAARREAKKARKAKRDTSLDQGLAQLNQRLGLTNAQRPLRASSQLKVDPTAHLARSLYYSSDLDGYAEPGEVVWITVPSTPPQERSMLVIGRDRHKVLGLLISTKPDHAAEKNWMEIGNGEWDTSTDQCFLRLDKTLVVPEVDVTRRGILFPERRFEVVASRLRNVFRWV